MSKPRMRMFAGPNGSGKSYLVQQLREKNIPVDPVVNSDVLLDELSTNGFTDLKKFGFKAVTQDEWNKAIQSIPELKSRLELASQTAPISISDSILTCNKEYFTGEQRDANAYLPALISDFIRHKILDEKRSFSFETVMSHAGKVEFITKARKKGYTTYLYYLATESVSINIQKVANRVASGGHDVPENKVEKRYYKSLELLLKALKRVDRAYVIDTSKSKSEVILEKHYDGRIIFHVKRPPLWVDKYITQFLTDK